MLGSGLRHARQAERGHRRQDFGVPGIVAEAGGVGEQLAQGDRAARRAELRRAIGAEALQHLRGGEAGQVGGNGAIERQPALFDQLHGGGGGDGLGHGGEPHHAVRRHRRLGGAVGGAEGALIEDAAGIAGEGDHAGDRARGDGVLQQGIDGGMGHSAWLLVSRAR